MDPQQRQLLERGYSALHAAGMSKAALLGAVVAVNVGQWSTPSKSLAPGKSRPAGSHEGCSGGHARPSSG